MRVRKRPIDDPEVLRFLSENSSSLFNREEWFRVLREGFKVPVLSYCLERDGRICLALPGMIFNFGIVRMFYSNIPYGGFVGDVPSMAPSLTLFHQCLRQDGIHVIRIGKDFSNAFPDVQGYGQQMVYTHLLDLQGLDEEKLWTGYKKRVRRDVRKAEKSGIYLEEIQSRGEIEEMFALYYQTMRRNLAYLTWTKTSLYAIYDHMVKSGKGRILFARKEGKIVAGIILLFSEDTAYYFFSASSEEYFQYCPNDLLVHRAICTALENGKTFFDLMTSRADDADLMSFKEKWGAQRHPFLFYEKSLNPLRTWMWKRAWWLMNTSVGARAIRWWRGR